MRSNKVLVLLLMFVLVLTGLPGLARGEAAIHFEDENLKVAIGEFLGVAGDAVTPELMAGIVELDLKGLGITSLAGLEYAVNLEALVLDNNPVRDLSPIAGLQSLLYLQAVNAGISDLTPLQNLNLVFLNLSENYITDLSPLSGQEYLVEAWLDFNSIQDITPLTGLNNLVVLSLWGNDIRNTGTVALPSLQYVDLDDNGLESAALLSSSPALVLAFLGNNKLTSLSPLAGLANLVYLGVEDNLIQDISYLTQLVSLEGADLRFNPFSDQATINTLMNRGAEVTYGDVVLFGDSSVEQAVRTALNLSTTAQVTRNNMEKLTALSVRDVTDLYGLEYAVNLTRLEIWSTGVVGAHEIRGLNKLTKLHLTESDIESMHFVRDLTALQHLNLSANNLENSLPLERLVNLNYLDLGGNNLKEVTGVENLSKLEFLNLANNHASDITPLSGLTNLGFLLIGGNDVQDITALSGMTKLYRLEAQNNRIQDLAPLAETAMEYLVLHDNELQDISLLSQLTGLEKVFLENNPLDLSAQTPARRVLAALRNRGVTLYHDAYPPAEVTRLKGVNRYYTAAAISIQGWQEQVETVILARGDEYADALAGVPLAHALGAPILLTESGRLSPAAGENIERLQAARVIILGGTGAVSQAVEDELTRMGYAVERIYGPNRFATAAAIARELAPQGVETAVVAFGRNFPDALAAASYAAIQGYPILLTEAASLPEATRNAVTELGVQQTLVVGGSGVISENVARQLPEHQRISGANRYVTAVALARHFDPGAHMYIATGTGFADAITGAVLAAKEETGLLLVEKYVHPEVSKYIAQEGDIWDLTIFGGDGAVSEAVRIELEKTLP